MDDRGSNDESNKEDSIAIARFNADAGRLHMSTDGRIVIMLTVVPLRRRAVSIVVDEAQINGFVPKSAV